MVVEEFFYNNYYITADEIHIIRSAFVESGSYGSGFREIYLVKNTYTGPRRGNRDFLPLFKDVYLKTTKNP